MQIGLVLERNNRISLRKNQTVRRSIQIQLHFMNYPSIKGNFITVYCRLDRSPNSTLLTYFSELCEKTPFGEISLENFLTFPNNPQNGGNYSLTQLRIYVLSDTENLSSN
jgi:hypothetical protein